MAPKVPPAPPSPIPAQGHGMISEMTSHIKEASARLENPETREIALSLLKIKATLEEIKAAQHPHMSEKIMDRALNLHREWQPSLLMAEMDLEKAQQAFAKNDLKGAKRLGHRALTSLMEAGRLYADYRVDFSKALRPTLWAPRIDHLDPEKTFDALLAETKNPVARGALGLLALGGKVLYWTASAPIHMGVSMGQKVEEQYANAEASSDPAERGLKFSTAPLWPMMAAGETIVDGFIGGAKYIGDQTTQWDKELEEGSFWKDPYQKIQEAGQVAYTLAGMVIAGRTMGKTIGGGMKGVAQGARNMMNNSPELEISGVTIGSAAMGRPGIASAGRGPDLNKIGRNIFAISQSGGGSRTPPPGADKTDLDLGNPNREGAGVIEDGIPREHRGRLVEGGRKPSAQKPPEPTSPLLMELRGLKLDVTKQDGLYAGEITTSRGERYRIQQIKEGETSLPPDHPPQKIRLTREGLSFVEEGSGKTVFIDDFPREVKAVAYDLRGKRYLVWKVERDTPLTPLRFKQSSSPLPPIESPPSMRSVRAAIPTREGGHLIINEVSHPYSYRLHPESAPPHIIGVDKARVTEITPMDNGRSVVTLEINRLEAVRPELEKPRPTMRMIPYEIHVLLDSAQLTELGIQKEKRFGLEVIPRDRPAPLVERGGTPSELPARRVSPTAREALAPISQERVPFGPQLTTEGTPVTVFHDAQKNVHFIGRDSHASLKHDFVSRRHLVFKQDQKSGTWSVALTPHRNNADPHVITYVVHPTKGRGELKPGKPVKLESGESLEIHITPREGVEGIKIIPIDLALPAAPVAGGSGTMSMPTPGGGRFDWLLRR